MKVKIKDYLNHYSHYFGYVIFLMICCVGVYKINQSFEMNTYREEEMAMMTVNEVSKLTGVSTDAIQRVLSQESVDIRNLFL